MQYTLYSGKRTTVAKHKHATVLLEQQLIAISKQAQHARHESFTTTARQTQFGSCDSVPQLYLPAPQLRSIVGRQKIDVIRYDIKEAYARALRMVARVITFHFRVSLSDRLFRFEPSVQGQPSVEASAAANNQHSTSCSLTDTNSTTACKSHVRACTWRRIHRLPSSACQ